MEAMVFEGTSGSVLEGLHDHSPTINVHGKMSFGLQSPEDQDTCLFSLEDQVETDESCCIPGRMEGTSWSCSELHF